MQEFQIPKVRLHHIVFAISGIIAAFVVEYFFFNENIIENNFWDFIAYALFLLFTIKILIFVVYAKFFSIIPSLRRYQTKMPLGICDIDLSASIIITTFLIKDLASLIDGPLLIILLIIPIFLLVYLINAKVVPFPK